MWIRGLQRSPGRGLVCRAVPHMWASQSGQPGYVTHPISKEEKKVNKAGIFDHISVVKSEGLSRCEQDGLL